MNKLTYTIATPFILVCLTTISGCASNHYSKVQESNVVFYLKDHEAKEVYFVSSVDQFQYNEALQVKRGLWLHTSPMDTEFSYFYVIDGVITIPECTITVQDDFGGRNCVFSPET